MTRTKQEPQTPRTLSDETLDQASGEITDGTSNTLMAGQSAAGRKRGNVEFEWKVEEGES